MPESKETCRREIEESLERLTWTHDQLGEPDADIQIVRREIRNAIEIIRTFTYLYFG